MRLPDFVASKKPSEFSIGLTAQLLLRRDMELGRFAFYGTDTANGAKCFEKHLLVELGVKDGAFYGDDRHGSSAQTS